MTLSEYYHGGQSVMEVVMETIIVYRGSGE